MYIVLEGIIGTGKTTQSKKLAEYLKQKFPEKEIVTTREPGGTEIAEVIRKVVQGTEFEEEMECVCEAYLYAASRAQSLRKIVKPVIDRGGIVVSDRSFITSLTNRAFGRDLGLQKVLDINLPAVAEIMPDLVLFMDLDIKKGMLRAFDQKGDKFESLGEDFYQKVYNGHNEVTKLPIFKDKWLSIDADGTIDEVFERVKLAVESFLLNRV